MKDRIKRALDCAKKRGKVTRYTTLEEQVLSIIDEISEARIAWNAGKKANISCKDYIRIRKKSILITGKKDSYKEFRQDYIDVSKDTIEFELSDIVIGCFTLAGMLGIEKINILDMDHLGDSYLNNITSFFLDKHQHISYLPECDFHPFLEDQIKAMAEVLEVSVSEIYEFAKHHGIDLDKFIELKMKYNEIRED